MHESQRETSSTTKLDKNTDKLFKIQWMLIIHAEYYFRIKSSVELLKMTQIFDALTSEWPLLSIIGKSGKHFFVPQL